MVGGSKPLSQLYRFPEATVDLPQLQTAAAGIGFANALVDDDGVIQRIPVVAEAGRSAGAILRC